MTDGVLGALPDELAFGQRLGFTQEPESQPAQ